MRLFTLAHDLAAEKTQKLKLKLKLNLNLNPFHCAAAAKIFAMGLGQYHIVYIIVSGPTCQGYESNEHVPTKMSQ